MMLSIVVTFLVTVFLAYVGYVLFWGRSTETGTSIDDYIADPPDDGEGPGVTPESVGDRYCTRYEEPGKQILILYGTEYGFSEELAKKLFDRLQDNGCQELSLQPRVLNAKDFAMVEFDREQVLLCVFSTTGDGVPPTEAKPFLDFLSTARDAPSLGHVHYSVLALGDSNYPRYCKTGRSLEARLEVLGGHCLHGRVDIDQEDWPNIDGWIEGVVGSVGGLELSTTMDYLDLSSQGEEDSGHSRTRPFTSNMTVKYPLTVTHSISDRETLHTEFDLSGSGLIYTSGDALGIYPQNNPPEVDALTSALRCSAEQLVPVPSFCYHPKPAGDKISLREALTKYYDLKTVKYDLVRLVVESVTDEDQRRRGEELLRNGLSKQNLHLVDYVAEREVADVLGDFPSFTCPLSAVLPLLKALQPRYYSIASSPKKDADCAAVCAVVLRYDLLGKPRTGVCTTFLQDRVAVGDTCPVFISHNDDFRLPTNGDRPIVMIGPGTGIAPFRAFIQERVLTGATGKNVFYFGCRHKEKDYLYKEELEQWESEGVLHLRVAFSRDQPEKVYVQNLIAEDGNQLWELMQESAHIYVCGDAKSMAGDVHRALLQIIVTHGGRSETEAAKYMEQLEQSSRYQKDVWVT